MGCTHPSMRTVMSTPYFVAISSSSLFRNIIACLYRHIKRCPGFVCSSDQSWAVTTFYPFRTCAGYLKLRAC